MPYQDRHITDLAPVSYDPVAPAGQGTRTAERRLMLVLGACSLLAVTVAVLTTVL